MSFDVYLQDFLSVPAYRSESVGQQVLASLLDARGEHVVTADGSAAAYGANDVPLDGLMFSHIDGDLAWDVIFDSDVAGDWVIQPIGGSRVWSRKNNRYGARGPQGLWGGPRAHGDGIAHRRRGRRRLEHRSQASSPGNDGVEEDGCASNDRRRVTGASWYSRSRLRRRSWGAGCRGTNVRGLVALGLVGGPPTARDCSSPLWRRSPALQAPTKPRRRHGTRLRGRQRDRFAH